jgi:hypothetical protein
MITYFLFGKEAIDLFHLLEGIPESKIAEQLKDIQHATFRYDNQTHPSELLSAYDGWGDYLVIPQTLYELL